MTLSIHLNSLRYVYHDFLVSFPCGNIRPGSLASFFLLVRTYEAMAAMLHDFYHFLPSPSVSARMGIPSVIRCTYEVRR